MGASQNHSKPPSVQRPFHEWTQYKQVDDPLWSKEKHQDVWEVSYSMFIFYLPKMIQFPGSTSYIHWEVQYHFWEDSILSQWKSMRSFLLGKYVMLLLWYLATSFASPRHPGGSKCREPVPVSEQPLWGWNQPPRFHQVFSWDFTNQKWIWGVSENEEIPPKKMIMLYHLMPFWKRMKEAFVHQWIWWELGLASMMVILCSDWAISLAMIHLSPDTGLIDCIPCCSGQYSQCS
jgi:hypothetical protein